MRLVILKIQCAFSVTDADYDYSLFFILMLVFLFDITKQISVLLYIYKY